MKKTLLILAILSFFVGTNVFAETTPAPQPVVKAEVPTEKNTFKESVQETTDKAVKATKNFSKKTVESTKKAYEKTKDFTSDAVDNTKYTLENLNPNKEVTLEDLKQDAKINTLKDERKELKSAFNSRIKDTKAKIKTTEQSLNLSDVQRRNKVYNLQKDLADMEAQRDKLLAEYDAKIKDIESTAKAKAKAKREAEKKAKQQAKAKQNSQK